MPPWTSRRVQRRALVALAGGVLGIVAGAVWAWGGCAAIPDVAVMQRRGVVCAAVGYPDDPDCLLAPRRIASAVIAATETGWTLYIGGVAYGTFALPEGSERVGRGRCRDPEYVRGLLRWHTGGPEVQAAVHARWGLRDGEVAYLDDLLSKPERATQDLCVIRAQVMIVGGQP